MWAADWKVAVISGADSSLTVIFVLSAPEHLVKLRLAPPLLAEVDTRMLPRHKVTVIVVKEIKY